MRSGSLPPSGASNGCIPRLCNRPSFRNLCRPLFRGGAGAIQLAGRFEALGFHSDAPWDEPFRNPRAANVLGNDFRAWTVGINWYPVRYVKLQLNVVREHLGDPERRTDTTRGWSTSRLFRVQLSL